MKQLQYITMKINYGVWHSREMVGQDMENIVIFLEDVGWNGAIYFSKSLLDKEIDQMEGNNALLLRKNDVVSIDSKYAEGFFVDPSDFKVTSLVDLLQQWGTMCSTYPQSLSGAYITYDSEKFTVTPEYLSWPAYIKKRIAAYGTKILRPFKKYIDPIIPNFMRKKGKAFTGAGAARLHHDFQNELEREGIFTITEKAESPATGMMSATVMRPGTHCMRSRLSFFPSTWSREMVLEKITVVCANPSTQPQYKGGVWYAQGRTNDGEYIEYLFNQEGELLSAYPLMLKHGSEKYE